MGLEIFFLFLSPSACSCKFIKKNLKCVDIQPCYFSNNRLNAAMTGHSRAIKKG